MKKISFVFWEDVIFFFTHSLVDPGKVLNLRKKSVTIHHHVQICRSFECYAFCLDSINILISKEFCL